MSELAKIQTSTTDRSARELIAVALVLLLLAAVQTTYVGKHAVTFAAILAPAPFGIIAP